MRPGEEGPRHGNDGVIKALEFLLAEARKGKMGYIGFFTGEYPAHKTCGAAGILDLERLALEAKDDLMKLLGKAKQNRILPRRPETTADHVVYNCASAPIGWDFLVWLVDAEMTRIREGAPAPLKVRWWFGRDGNTGLVGGSNARMFANVLKPLLPLIGAVEETENIIGRHKDVYVLRDITEHAKLGEAVPTVQSSSLARETIDPWFKDGRRPITITLREADHWPHRNSNIPAWVQFARDLRMKGERVIFMRDTCMVPDWFYQMINGELPPTFKPKPEPEDSLFYGLELCHAASVNIDIRMALYERAKCNLLISNGPCGLCLFSSAPYLYFLAISEDDPHPPNRPGFWPKANGIPDGGQLPWAKPHQRFIWKTDTYENLSAAWEQFQPILRKAA